MRTLNTISIIPHYSVFPYLRVYSDRLALISPVIGITAMPHISLAGVELDDSDTALISDWKSDLQQKLSGIKSFKLELGRQMRMSGGRFADNFSLSVPATPELIALTEQVIEVTHKHFPKLDKRGLWSLTDHVCLVENIPEQYRYAVAREAEQLWSKITVDVDRVWLVKGRTSTASKEPVFFADAVKTSWLEELIPNDPQTRWILAHIFARKAPMDKLSLQKLTFLSDYENSRPLSMHFVPYKHGPYSLQGQQLIDDFLAAGYGRWNGDDLYMTDVGRTIAAMCYNELPEQDRAAIARCMKKHGSKSTPELQIYVHGEYPDWRDTSDGRNYPDD